MIRKRMIGCGLSLIMALSVLTPTFTVDTTGTLSYRGATAYAAGLSYAVTGGNIYYDTTGTITDCDSDVTSADIPASIGNIQIKAIGDYAFSYTKLEDISLPEGITTIGRHAFVATNLVEIDIPNGVTQIGANAFDCCTKLSNVTIPDSVTTIGDAAFASCSSLTAVTIPAGVTTLGGARIFFANSKLTELTVDPDNTAFKSVDNVVFTKDGKELVYCIESKAGEYEIPEGVTTIRYCAFYNSDLSNIIIPDTVTNIESRAFYNCMDLTDINLPTGISSIGENTFSYCNKLTKIAIPAGVTTIGEYAFRACRGINSISLPESITTIGANAFYSCSGLTGVYYTGTEKQWNDIVINSSGNDSLTSAIIHCEASPEDMYTTTESTTESTTEATSETTTQSDFVFDSGTGTITGYTGAGGNVVIPDSIDGVAVRAIGARAFYYNNTLTGISIPEGVTTIGIYAFAGCAVLKAVIIPGSVKEIGALAFYNCGDLEQVTLSSGVTTIGNGAFSSCQWLWEITIPDTVVAIEGNVFTDCSRLNNILVDAGNTVYKSVDGVLFTIDGAELVAYPGSRAGEYTIPAGVTTIGYRAFADCIGLTGINMPDTVTNMERQGFYHCIGLTSISLPRGVTTIGEMAFNSCSNLTSIIMPKEVTAIGNNAFNDCTKLVDVYCYKGTVADDISIYSASSGIKYMGDADGDDSVDEIDARLILKESCSAGEATQVALDYNGDGVVDVRDCIALLKYVK